MVHVEGALQGERPAGTLEGEATPAPDHLDPLGASVKTEQNAEGLHEDVKPPPPPPGAPSAAALKEQRREERRRKKEERRAAKKVGILFRLCDTRVISCSGNFAQNRLEP